VEGAVLVAVEQVHDRALDAGHSLEIADRAGVDIDPACAFEPGGEAADARIGHVEAARAGADAARHMADAEGAGGDLEHQVRT
jgi:hypothetical protein